ncbi:MAG TPA: TolC family protein [Candidatus Eremiobacteraceae bacterium]|nr:TolC family protein [Candidatus Eremiobacteraceae bacterium]
MLFPCLRSVTRVTVVNVLLSTLTLAVWGQEPPAAPVPQNTPETRPLPILDYTKPVTHFPNPVGPYTPRHVAAPNLANTARIDSLMHDGKLYLSLNDAIALALENNLDVAIARYNLNIADTDVLRAKAGASILGINAGVVQNTPGGGVGGIGATAGASTGGTSLGAGGIGAGTNGLVSSTLGLGPNITSFDPVVTATLQEDHLESVSSSLFNGVPILAQNTGTVNFNYTQGFDWGTNLQVGFSNTRATSNVPFNTYSPLINSSLRLQVTQHLLQGLGFPANSRFIHIAKNNRELSDVAFRLQIIDSVDQIENIYWDLVYAYENARVQNESLAFAQKTLSDTRKQVEIGSLAPIEVVRAQSTVAQDQQLVTQAQTNLQLEQLLMKNALTRTLKDQTLATAEVIPTSTIDVPAQEEVIPTEDLVNDALRHRAELVESRIDLNSRDYSNKAVRSALLPTLDAFAYYAGSGLGGSQNPSNLCANQTPEQLLLGFCAGPNVHNPAETIPIVASTSIGGTWNQLVNSTAPDKGVGLSLNIPLRNRAGQAVQIRSELEYRQAQMRLQQIENQVGIEVRNAQYAVQQNRASVDSAKAALDLARQSLDAEQKKYQFGTSTTTLVLQYESQLATAESTLVNATVAYEKSRIELDRATGSLLDHNGISVDDAARGHVTRLPNVPYITPRKDLPSVSQPAPQANSQQQ